MKNIKHLVVAVLAIAAFASSNVQATPVVLGTFSHDYGSDAGKFDPGGNDALSGDYVTVSDKSTARFGDAFDFSSLDYSLIDHFAVTLNFSQTNKTGLFTTEDWRVRPGATNPATSGSLPALTRVGDTVTSQTFIFGPSTDTFATALSSETFSLWLANEGYSNNNFRLYDATVAVYGEAADVPEPSSLALVGLGVLGLGTIQRRRRNRSVQS